MKTAFFVLVGLCVSLRGEAIEWEVPSPAHKLEFPRDHGSHPDFKIEWWYITGHLYSDDRRFGFQATFFRLGQKPGSSGSEGLIGKSQLYLAHMGISDPESGCFFHEERLNREGWDAGAKVGDLEVWNGNWSLVREGELMRLVGGIRGEVEWQLTLEPEKGPVIFGEDGISRKGPEGTAASYYITYPRIRTSGILQIGDEALEVSGEAWMDHEISSSQLDRNQIGWDWACLQFEDGREIMGYVLRTSNGGQSPYSKLVWIDESDDLVHLTLEDYSWVPEGEWASPETGAVYPIEPRISAIDPKSGKRREWKLRPIMSEQEMVGKSGGVSYWEGACDIVEVSSGEVVGRAFLEMTGYADDIGAKLR